jgi:hypothetical protein
MEQALANMITEQRADIADWHRMIDRANDDATRRFAYAGLRMSRERLNGLVTGEHFED